MRNALKVGVVLLPFAVVFLALRACSDRDAERLRDNVAQFDAAAQVVVDRPDLIVIAPDPGLGKAAATEVARFRDDVLKRYGNLLGTPVDVRMQVVIFSKVEQLQAFATNRLRHGVSQQLYGYTDPQSGAIYVPQASLETLRHETIHWIVGCSRRSSPDRSPWLSEGLAQLFESGDPGIPREQRPLLRMYVRDGTIDYERLVAIHDYAEFTGREGIRNYGEALLLTAFLFERDPDALGAYVALDFGGPDSALAFRRHFGASRPDFEQDLRKFLAKLR